MLVQRIKMSRYQPQPTGGSNSTAKAGIRDSWHWMGGQMSIVVIEAWQGRLGHA